MGIQRFIYIIMNFTIHNDTYKMCSKKKKKSKQYEIIHLLTSLHSESFHIHYSMIYR